MKPYYDHAGITIYHGDCRDVLPTIRDASIDSVITDPPYNVSATDETAPHITRKDDADLRFSFGAWDFGFDPLWFLDHAQRVLGDGGQLIAFTGDLLLPVYLTQTPLRHRRICPWLKTNATPRFRGGYQSAVEWYVWQVKAGSVYWGGDGLTPNYMFGPYPFNGTRFHPTQKPLWLMTRLVQLHSAETSTILDPFMGSGTTLRAAKDLGRRCTGIEIDERYCEIAATRLSQEVFEMEVA